MPIHILKLLNRRDVAKETIVFEFEKPQGFNFKPGQYAGFTLINPKETDQAGTTRRFSILSTPDDDLIAIVTRIQRSAFKQVLKALPIGGEVKFAGPTGAFTLHEDLSIPAVLIAGGIGIAPFYSMICHATKHKIPQKITLFYGNPSIANTAFLKELLLMERQNPYFKLIATLDQVEPEWTGETGYITLSMIKKSIPDLNLPNYYICGSPVMVTTLQEVLAEALIDEDRIKVEDFPGY